MPTAREIMANAKKAILLVQSDLDKSLNNDESIAVTDAAAQSLDTVNPTLVAYPKEILT